RQYDRNSRTRTARTVQNVRFFKPIISKMRFNRTAQFPPRARSGHTLAEVLVAAAFLGISVISLYTEFFSGFQVTHMSRENVRATQILLKKLETLRLCSWNQLSIFPPTFQETFDVTPPETGAHALIYYGTVTFA